MLLWAHAQQQDKRLGLGCSTFSLHSGRGRVPRKAPATTSQFRTAWDRECLTSACCCSCLPDSGLGKRLGCSISGPLGPVPANVAKLRDGSWSGSFLPPCQGFFRLEISLDSRGAGRSPYSLQARAMSPPACFLSCS